MSFGFMDIIIVFCGLYLVYIAVDMKRTGEINNTTIVGKGYDIKKAKDPKGFIDYMYIKTIVVGLLVAVSGVLDYFNETYWQIRYFGFGVCAVFFVIIIVYSKLSMDAQKKYLSPK